MTKFDKNDKNEIKKQDEIKQNVEKREKKEKRDVDRFRGVVRFVDSFTFFCRRNLIENIFRFLFNDCFFFRLTPEETKSPKKLAHEPFFTTCVSIRCVDLMAEYVVLCVDRDENNKMVQKLDGFVKPSSCQWFAKTV